MDDLDTRIGAGMYPKQAAVLFTSLMLLAACSSQEPVLENAGNPEPVQALATDAQLPEEGEAAVETELAALPPAETESVTADTESIELEKALDPIETVRAEIKILEADLMKAPFDADIRFILASDYWRIDELDKAVEYFNETLRLDPMYHAAHWNLSVLHDQRGQGPEAILHMQAAERIFLEKEDVKSLAKARRLLRGYFSKYGFEPEDFAMPKGFFARLFD